MNRLLKLFFTGATIFFTFQIMRALFGDIRIEQFIILTILIVIMLILCIFILGRGRIQVKHYSKDNPYYDNKEEISDSQN
jgi:hypothetical protein